MKKKTPLIFGNWKMQLEVKASVALAKKIAAQPSSAVTVGVFPSFDALAQVHETLAGTGIVLGAQDCHWEEKGAFTGEESAGQLVAVGCTHTLVGHSERRVHFAETDEMVNRKIKAAQKAGLTPVLCVGENEIERRDGRTTLVIESQVHAALEGLALVGSQELVIAYEPVWAIGTGKPCAPAEAAEVHAFIRTVVGERLGTGARRVRLIYGGSVDAGNIASYLREGDIEGALVGGASQKAASFLALIAAASN